MFYGKSFVSDLIGNVNDCPLEEQFFNPDNLADNLNNEKYHHSYKGCDVEMRLIYKRTENSKVCVNKFCKTHNILCSKTGWELGWYMGKKSLLLNSARQHTEKCSHCGKEFIAFAFNSKYCGACIPLVNRLKYELWKLRHRKI